MLSGWPTPSVTTLSDGSTVRTYRHRIGAVTAALFDGEVMLDADRCTVPGAGWDLAVGGNPNDTSCATAEEAEQALVGACRQRAADLIAMAEWLESRGVDDAHRG